MNSSDRVGGEGPRARVASNRERLDIRYPPAPYCRCGRKVELRVVETIGKATIGKLYYSCRGCGFFVWVNPHSVMWSPSGVPVRPPFEEMVTDFSNFHGHPDVGDRFDDMGEVASTLSGINRAEVPEVKGQGHDQWKIMCVFLMFVLFVLVLLK